MTDRIVDGGTQVLAIVGDPVRQARAPRLWTALFRASGVNALCLPFHVAPAGLAAFVAGMRTVRNLAGLIVTVPHKPAAARLADRLTPRARRVGAANLLRADPEGGWTGDMQDGEGFTRGLLRAGQVLRGRRATTVPRPSRGRAAEAGRAPLRPGAAA